MADDADVDEAPGGMGLFFACRKCHSQIAATTRTPADAKLPCCGVTMAEGCPSFYGFGESRNYACKYTPPDEPVVVTGGVVIGGWLTTATDDHRVRTREELVEIRRQNVKAMERLREHYWLNGVDAQPPADEPAVATGGGS